MKRGVTAFLLLSLAVAARAAPQASGPASKPVVQDDSTGTAGFASEVAAVTAQLKRKFDAREIAQTNLAENIAAIHGLILKHQKDADREQLSRLYLLDAHIQADGLKDAAKAREIWAYVEWAFPGTRAAQGAKLCEARLDADLNPQARLGEPPQLGVLAPNFAAIAINGKIVRLSDYRGRIVVLESHCYACGATKIEYESGGLQSVQSELAAKGVVWLIIDPGQQVGRLKRHTSAEARSEWASLNTTITDWIIDNTNLSLCRLYGFLSTPQMAVIDQKGVLAYTGAMHKHLTAGGATSPEDNCVRNAVNELLAGKVVSVPHVKPGGCPILYPEYSTTPGTWAQAYKEQLE